MELQIPGWLKWAAGVVVAAFGAWIASMPEAVLALWALQLLDIVSGVVSGYVHRKLSSEVSRAGIGKKIQANLVILMVFVIEYLLPDVGLPVSFVTMTALFYCAHEALSIIENAAEIGLPIPDGLRQALARLSEAPQRGEDTRRQEG